LLLTKDEFCLLPFGQPERRQTAPYTAQNAAGESIEAGRIVEELKFSSFKSSVSVAAQLGYRCSSGFDLKGPQNAPAMTKANAASNSGKSTFG
jgi:hypothetical protein